MRKKLIDVAIQQFGDSGFDGASTRDIAAQAATTMSNITYHFGGKEGLYRAAAEAIVARFSKASAAQMATVLPDDAPKCDRINMICSVLRAIGAFMLSDEAAPLARFVAREQQNPNSVIREYFARDIQPMSSALGKQIAILRPDLSAQAVQASVFFLVSMATSLRSSRLSLCILMDVQVIGDDLTQLLLARLEATARETLEPRA